MTPIFWHGDLIPWFDTGLWSFRDLLPRCDTDMRYCTDMRDESWMWNRDLIPRMWYRGCETEVWYQDFKIFDTEILYGTETWNRDIRCTPRRYTEYVIRYWDETDIWYRKLIPICDRTDSYLLRYDTDMRYSCTDIRDENLDVKPRFDIEMWYRGMKPIRETEIWYRGLVPRYDAEIWSRVLRFDTEFTRYSNASYVIPCYTYGILRSIWYRELQPRFVAEI